MFDGCAGQDKYRIAGYICIGVTTIVLCIAIALRRSIAVAIRVIRLGARAMGNVPGMVLYAIVDVTLLVSLLVRERCVAWWGVGCRVQCCGVCGWDVM